MNREVIQNIVRFILVVLLQGLVFINIELFDGKMELFYYIIFILLLPLRITPIATMGLSFLLGLSVDLFYNTMGVHASACVLIGYVRTKVLGLLAPRDGYDVKDKPTVGSLGLLWFIQYAFLMAAIHHIYFYFIEAFSLFGAFGTLSKGLLTMIFSVAVLILGQFLFHSARKGGA